MIAVRNLSYRFPGSSDNALSDINISIEAGEFVVITGPSGCGKSTLAMAIGGYLFRQYDGQAAGEVRVRDLDVRQCPVYDVAEIVGLVQQNPEAQFCTLTVQDEVAFALENRCLAPDEIGQRVDWALEIVGALHLKGRLLATLSGGEKQKVAVAAMMASKPEVLIFDEPTSNLDPSATAEIFKVIAHIRAKAGIAVVVIEHKLDFLSAFNPRLVVMREGRIVYDGPAVEEQRPARMADRPANHPGSVSPGEDLVRVQDLRAGYDNGPGATRGRPALRDVSLQVRPGEFIAVMGDNGSGKTTFLKSLLGLLKPQAGSVEVLGEDTRHVPVSQLARQVGFVFQNPDHQLFADSVWDEAVFAPRNLGTLDGATEGRVRVLLSRCGLQGREAEHPYKLSYGEKRRLNLISVLAQRPRVILLDEVLIGQDAENAAFLMDLLRDLAEAGGAVVLVTHDPEVARVYAQRVLFFNSGRVVVDAATEKAFAELAAQGNEVYLPAGWAGAEVGR